MATSDRERQLYPLTVQDARREGLAKSIAEHTSLSLSAVYGRLRRAHGRTLLRNAFKDAWPASTQQARAKQPKPRQPKPRSPAKSQPRSAERTVHRVRQEYSTSCGVAAVAMLARVSHDEAMAVMFPRPRNTFYTHYKDVRKGLDHFGVSHGGRATRIKDWDDVPTTALVKVKWQRGARTYWHWVILQRKKDGTHRVLDPDVRKGTLTLAESGANRYAPVSYMSVDAVPPRPR